jgi:enoyl-CoA hydratase/carnithine racemase
MDKLKLQGASDAGIDILYNWGDERLHKAFTLYQTLDKLRKSIRVLSICAGGTRYGGSAEMVLMADIIVGDSRSALCFSESLIGLIPGWGGIGRTISKAGWLNAKCLAYTSVECKALDLKNIGVFNAVVDVPFPLPRIQKTDNPADDKTRYLEALEKNNEQTGRLLLPAALELATCPEAEIPGLKPDERKNLITDSQLQEIIRRRSNPDNYRNLWNKPLSEVKDEILKIGRPLAPQSIDALNTLFSGYDPATFNEERFIKQEMELDARLYRDSRFRAGIIATLEQKVADFSDR